MVGITGGSGSGKTSFVRRLRERLGEAVTVFSQDDYYRPAAQVPLDPDGVHNFDLPESIDSATMAADVRCVMDGQTVERQEYGFETAYRDDRPTDSVAEATAAAPRATVRFAPAPVLVVEGLFVLHERALTEMMDLKVFVDVSDVAKMSRRIRRDRTERGLPLDDVLFRYEAHVLPAYRTYIEPYRRAADVVVNNYANFDAGLDVLATFLAARAAEPEPRVVAS